MSKVPATLVENAEAQELAMWLLGMLLRSRKGHTIRITRTQADKLGANTPDLTMVRLSANESEVIAALEPHDPEMRALAGYVDQDR